MRLISLWRMRGLFVPIVCLPIVMVAAVADNGVPQDGEKLAGKDAVSAPIVQYGNGELSSNIFVSPGGTQFLTGSRDGRVRLWDAVTGLPVRTFSGHLNQVNVVSLSADGKKVLSSSYDGTLRVWDAATGARLHMLAFDPRFFITAAFSPDGTKALTGSAYYPGTADPNDTTAKLWDLATGSQLMTFVGHTGVVSLVAFSPDGSRVLTGSGYPDYSVKLWETVSGNELFSVTPYAYGSTWAAFAHDGSKVLLGTFLGDTASLRDAVTGGEIRSLSASYAGVSCAAFSPDGSKILGGGLRTATLWDAGTGVVLRKFTGHTDLIYSAGFSADGTKVFTGSGNPLMGLTDDTIRLWDPATGEELHCYTGHTPGMNCAAFSPDKTKVLTGLSTDMTILWDAATGASLRSFAGGAVAVSFSPDGKKVLTASGKNIVRLLDTASGDEQKSFAAHIEPLCCAVLSPDGTRVLTGSLDSTAKLWDLETATELSTFTGHIKYVYRAAFSPDGKKVITGSGDKTAKIWDANTGTELLTLSGHYSDLSAVAFSPDGSKVLTGSADTLAMLWDATTGAHIRTFQGHTYWLLSAVFAHDGTRILTGGDENAILWDAATGEPLRTFVNRSGMLMDAIMSPDDKNVLAVSDGGVGMLFPVSGGVVDVVVPDVTGQTQDGAQESFAAAGLPLESITQQCGNSIAVGLVMSQYPAASSRVPTGTAVSLVVSAGPCPVVVPVVTGQAQTATGAVLAEANLTTGTITQQCNDSVAAGIVFNQSPTAGQEAPFGGAVDLTVSSGPCPVAVPAVAGQTQMTASTAIAGARLVVGTVSRQCSDSVAIGLVIMQNPESGALVPPGSAVTLALSSGPCHVSVPDVAGRTLEAAERAITEAGLSVGAVTEQCSEAVDSGKVASQSLNAETMVNVGSTVALVVSTGPCFPTVPNLAGQLQIAALMMLSTANLASGSVTQRCSDTMAAGQVVDQNPAAGAQVPHGTSVAIIVSTGPCDNTPQTLDALRSRVTADFETMDGDGDGKLSYAELLSPLPGLSTDLFNDMDTDRNGFISRAEAGVEQSSGCAGHAGAKRDFDLEKVRKSFSDLLLGSK